MLRLSFLRACRHRATHHRHMDMEHPHRPHHRTSAPAHHRTTAPPHHRTTAPPHHRTHHTRRRK
jgi:hypothetical protein